MDTSNKILPFSAVKVVAVFLIASLVSGCSTHFVTISSLTGAQGEEGKTSEEVEVGEDANDEGGISALAVTGIVLGAAAAAGSAGGSGDGDKSTPDPDPQPKPKPMVLICENGYRNVGGRCVPNQVVCEVGYMNVNGVCRPNPPNTVCREGFVVNGLMCDPTFAYSVEVMFNGIIPGFGDVSTNSVYCEALKSSKSKVRYVLSNNVGDHQRAVARYANYLNQCIDSSGDAFRWFDVVRVDNSCSGTLIFSATVCGTGSNNVIVRPLAVNGDFAYVHEAAVGNYPVLVSSSDNRNKVDNIFANWTREEVEILIANIKKGNDNFIIIVSSGGSTKCLNGSDSDRVFSQEDYDLVCSRVIALGFATRATPTDEELEGTTFARLVEILNDGLGDPDFEDSIGTSFSAAAVGVVVTFIARYYDVTPSQALDIFVASAVSTEDGFNLANIRKLFDVSGVLMSRNDALDFFGLKTALLSMSLPFSGNSVNVWMVDRSGRPINVTFDVVRSFGFQSVVCRTFCSKHMLTNWFSVDFGDDLMGAGVHFGGMSLSLKENINESKDFFGNHIDVGSVKRSVVSLGYTSKHFDFSVYKDERYTESFGLLIDGAVESHSIRFKLPLKKVRFDLSVREQEFSGSVNAGGYNLDLANLKQRDITFSAVIPF